MKKTLVKSLALACVGSLFVAGSAMALQLGLDDSYNGLTPSNTVDDNSAGDISGTIGKVNIADYTGVSGWTVDMIGQNFLTTGVHPYESFDLFNFSVSSAAEGDIWVMLSEIDLTGPGWHGSVGGTTDGEVEFFAYLNYDNSYWGDGSAPVITSATFGGTYTPPADAFSTTGIWNIDTTQLAADGLYSMIIGAHITHQGAGATSFDMAVDVVPEPATMLLFGTGLAGLAGVARKRRSKKA